MSDRIEGQGHCLCGAIHLLAKRMSKNVGACHCTMCRQWSGAPLLFVGCGQDVSFEGEENISIFHSSAWAERAFCKKCGSHLFYRLKDKNEYYVPVGLIQSDAEFVFVREVFMDEKPDYYCFAGEREKMAKSPAYNQYAPAARNSDS